MISLIKLPRILDDRGNLSFVENKAQLPFEIKRVYFIYDVPGGEVRGMHTKNWKKLLSRYQEVLTLLWVMAEELNKYTYIDNICVGN